MKDLHLLSIDLPVPGDLLCFFILAAIFTNIARLKHFFFYTQVSHKINLHLIS